MLIVMAAMNTAVRGISNTTSSTVETQCFRALSKSDSDIYLQLPQTVFVHGCMGVFVLSTAVCVAAWEQALV
jgi:hypothetical protein